MRRFILLIHVVLSVHTVNAGVNGQRQHSLGMEKTRARIEEVSWKSSMKSPMETAFSYLREEGQSVGLTPDQSTFVALGSEEIPGGVHVRLAQTYLGIPVLGSETVVSINNRNEVVMVMTGAGSIGAAVDVRPSFDAAVASDRARGYLNVRGSLIDERPAELAILNTGTEGPYLVYRSLIVCSDPLGDWEILLDAHSGDLVSMEDRFVDFQYTQGTGFVYLPDPVTRARSRYGNNGFSDNDDATTAELDRNRTLVTLDSIRFDNGVYSLHGPHCSVTDIEAPANPTSWVAASADGFRFDRSEPGFEAVNAYYHATTAYQHLMSLGFSIPSLGKLRIDPHGYNGEDNSHYSPTGNWISFGEGGVDDAEDASVIWHEYAHAIQYNINPVWGGGETRALGEGFGDYWAASYAKSFDNWKSGDEESNWLFMWDGHNDFWSGRILNDSRTYPFGNLPAHDAGQIWSSALMGIWQDLGKEITDRLVIKSQYYLGYGVTAKTAARAILQADRDLYGGAHLSTLVYWLGTVKGFLDPIDELPIIDHTPLSGVTTSSGSIEIRAAVSSSSPRSITDVLLCWTINGEPIDSTFMLRDGSSEIFTAVIPITGDAELVEYFIVATDDMGTNSFSPYSAPSQVFSITAIETAGSGDLPDSFELMQNYPNPFNPTTEIGFRITEPGEVSVLVFDILGKEIATLLNKHLSAGSHSVSWNAAGVPGGVYFYQIRYGTVVETKKMMLLR